MINHEEKICWKFFKNYDKSSDKSCDKNDDKCLDKTCDVKIIICNSSKLTFGKNDSKKVGIFTIPNKENILNISDESNHSAEKPNSDISIKYLWEKLILISILKIMMIKCQIHQMKKKKNLYHWKMLFILMRIKLKKITDVILIAYFIP